VRSLVVDTPLPPSARWQPQHWRLRTKLIALTAIPAVLAIVLALLRIREAARHSHTTALRDAIVIGAVVLLAVILLIVLVRSILKPLRVLRASAFDVADQRLPAVIEQLRGSEGRDRDIKIDPVPVYSREDVGQVARAFDAVHSEAVRLASEQAALRANVNDMFVNLSRRTQSLVERQLQLIDQLELGEQDSERLAALFRLDHLATRMRRNGENLLVLAGAELRQRSGEPVPIVDVLRAAVSEIEDYRRVAMQSLPVAMVSGLAVNDIVHLVAELLDNATAYSDPESQVRLSARLEQDGGLTIEISDVGAGLSAARLSEINQRLAEPPAVDASVSRQMGLFVVGRLASRHGIMVRLSSEAGSGIAVKVTLPRSMVTLDARTGGRPDNLGRSYSQPTTVDTSVARREPGAFAWDQPFAEPAAEPVPAGAPGEPLNGVSNGLLESLESVVANDDDTDTGDTPIFQAMLSRWFTEHQATPLNPPGDGASSYPLRLPEPPAAPQASGQNGWESEADAGWQAAEAVREPTSVPQELTAAGLPKRRPQAFLVPGSVGTNGMMGQQPANAPARHADAVRDRMASYQRGLERGRHSRPGKPSEQVGASGGKDDEQMPEEQ
jgi:signal transduction histidine kinase